MLPQLSDYLVTIREKYARKEKTFRVPVITIDKFTKPDINETRYTYTINGQVFHKSRIMYFHSRPVHLEY